MTLDRMALVIPAWNEARRLDDAAFVAFVASQELVDLHFVDDGSRDATPARLAALAAAAPGRITVQRLDPNRGKAEAVRAGLLAVLAEGYPLVGYLDADLAAPLDTALLLRDELVRWPSVSMVLGSRVKLLGWRIRRSERRHYLGRIFATCASITLALAKPQEVKRQLHVFKDVKGIQQTVILKHHTHLATKRPAFGFTQFMHGLT